MNFWGCFLWRSAVFLTGLFFSWAVYAWDDVGHMIVVAAAHEDLNPVAKSRMMNLLALAKDELYHEPFMASIWADHKRNSTTGKWHYINHHFRSDGKPVDNKPEEQNVVWAIERFKKVLLDPKENEEDKSKALIYLLHFVGDIHQPLHCVAHDCDEFPGGDRGGNDFKIKAPRGFPKGTTNLHRLWDLGCGFTQVEDSLDDAGKKQKAKELASQVRKEHPRGTFLAELRELQPMQWSMECLSLAKNWVYKIEPLERPSKEYLDKGQDIARKQLALAGYRLADLLNQTLGVRRFPNPELALGLFHASRGADPDGETKGNSRIF